MSDTFSNKQNTAFAARSHDMTSPQGDAVNNYIPKETLYKWVKLAKSQALVIELLQLELDTLSETIETGTFSITNNFQSLTNCVKESCDDQEVINKAQTSLSKVVKSLQYQDLANQQIENISNTLATLGKTFSFLLHETVELDEKGMENLSVDEKYLSQIISERTLGEMRDRMVKNLEKISEVNAELLDDNLTKAQGDSTDTPEDKSKSSDQDSVELF